MPPSPPDRCCVANGPSNAQRRPGPDEIARSTSATDTTPCSTSQYASRHSAACSRLVMWPGSSTRILHRRLADRLVRGHRLLDRRVGGGLAADDLDEWDQVGWVERVPDEHPFGRGGRSPAGAGSASARTSSKRSPRRAGDRVDLAVQLELQVEPFRVRSPARTTHRPPPRPPTSATATSSGEPSPATRPWRTNDGQHASTSRRRATRRRRADRSPRPRSRAPRTVRPSSPRWHRCR